MNHRINEFIGIYKALPIIWNIITITAIVTLYAMAFSITSCEIHL